MPRSKADQAEAIRHVRAAWESRGFRADYLAIHEHDRDEDPKSELAYQRAFAEAAKKDPPRLPNPSHYSNSPSAQALIQRQNRGIFNARPTDGPNPKYEQPIPDMYWQTKGGDPRSRSVSSTPPSHHSLPQTPSHQLNGQLPVPNGGTYTNSPTTARNPPLLMEPKMGAPMGPPSRLR